MVYMAFVSVGAGVASSITRSSTTISRSTFTQRPYQAFHKTPTPTSTITMQTLQVFDRAMKEFKDEFTPFARRGWGATVKAERWNGRHAMFGLLLLVITGYCKGHGLFPSGDVDLSQWGNLAYLGDYQAISNQRAAILIAHVHFLIVSIAASIAPFSFQEGLLLKPGEEDDKPMGLIPPFKGGLTKEAECFNGRVAMLGVCALVGTAFATGTPVLDVLNKGLGNLLF